MSSELISELGVNTNKNCGPRSIRGAVISDNAIVSVSDAEVAASGFAMSRLKFVDRKSFSFIPKRFPRNVNERTCISCYKLNETNYILKNCSVDEPQTHPIGKFSVRVNGTNTAFGTISTQFIDTTTNEVFDGVGDLTRNLKECGLFLFEPTVIKKAMGSEATRYEVKYFEYILDNSSCQNIIYDANGTSTIHRTKREVATYSIKCDADKELNSEWFQKSLRAYRALQLENTIDNLNQSGCCFPLITTEDVYRSVLSAKVIDGAESEGEVEYYEYFECGSYDPTFIFPFVICLLSMGILGVRSYMLVRNVNNMAVPNTSQSWYSEYHNSNIRIDAAQRNSNPNRSYFSLATDEFVLDGESVCIEVNQTEPRISQLNDRESTRRNSSESIDRNSFRYSTTRYSTWSEMPPRQPQEPDPVYRYNPFRIGR